MKSRQIVAALAASAGLMLGAAHAAPEAAEAAPGAPPAIIIFELQPAQPGVAPEAGQPPVAGEPSLSPGQPPEAQAQSEQEQLMLGMLLLQMLSGMHAPGEAIEVQQLPPEAKRI